VAGSGCGGRIWGPAWVAWRLGGGFVGWAPLSHGIEASVADIDVERDPLAFSFVEERYSMVAGADRVIVLETGRVTQTGTVAELSSGEGWFARFARRAARSEA
jgi:hypothetical protein